MGALTDHNNMGWLELTLKHHTVIMDMRCFQGLWWAVHLLFVFSLSERIIYIYICVAGVLAYRVGPSKIDNDPLFMHKLRYHLNAEAWGPSGSSDKIEL